MKPRNQVIETLIDLSTSEQFAGNNTTLKAMAHFYASKVKDIAIEESHLEWLMNANGVVNDYRPRILNIVFHKKGLQ